MLKEKFFILLKINLYKLFFLFFSLLLIYFKPYFSILLIIFILNKWIHSIFIFYKFITCFDNKYHELSIIYIDINEFNNFEIWLEIGKIQAYKNLYVFLIKKKYKYINIIKYLFIILLQIPINFLQFTYDFFKNNFNLRKTLELKYYSLYHELKNTKIEILKNKIYLNCYTFTKYINNLKYINPNITIQECFNLTYDLKKYLINIKEFENYNRKNIDLYLSYLKTNEGSLIPNPHYTYIKNTITIHQTSNITSKILNSQINEVSFPSLVKLSSKNPGTIISKDIIYLHKTNKVIWIPQYEIDSIMFDHLDLFDLSNQEFSYQLKKKEDILNIFSKNINNFDEKTWANSNIYKDIKIGNYSISITYLSNNEIIENIKNIFDN